MKLVRTIRELKDRLRGPGAGAGESVGFVPTMGFLHEGHLSLVRAAREENRLTVVSIFVNPTQFGPSEDFDSYPRDLERDLALLTDEGVDLVFHPQAGEMYPSLFHTAVRVRRLTEGLCGASRPGHFDGVATVVTKLFNIVRPDRAYFGLKDAQQVRVIEALVRDLNLDLGIRALPTVREEDGLALSSRNRRLSAEERLSAASLHRSLLAARDLIEAGEREAALIRSRMREIIEAEPDTGIDYISLVSWSTLEELTELAGDILVALAVRVGRTRLIDNIIVPEIPAAPAVGTASEEG